MTSLLGFLFLLSPLLIAIAWLAMTWVGIRSARTFVRLDRGYKLVRVAMITVIATIWFGASFWYGGGRKIYYDTQVRELCAKDGGVKVYEQVVLPAERFDKYGEVAVAPSADAKRADEFIYKWTVTVIRSGNPEIKRNHFALVRQADAKLLAEGMGYVRTAGDMPGPWHQSSFHCPEPNMYSIKAISKRIFQRAGNNEENRK